MKKYLTLLPLVLAGCGENTVSTPANDFVLLYRKGEFRKSEVKKTGAYCTVAWFRSIDNFALRRDGTAIDNILEYKWTLSEFGNAIDQTWFDKNCKDVK